MSEHRTAWYPSLHIRDVYAEYTDDHPP